MPKLTVPTLMLLLRRMNTYMQVYVCLQTDTHKTLQITYELSYITERNEKAPQLWSILHDFWLAVCFSVCNMFLDSILKVEREGGLSDSKERYMCYFETMVKHR